MSRQVIILKGREATQYARAINLARKSPEMTIDRAVSEWSTWLSKNGSRISAFQYSRYIKGWLEGVAGLPVSEIEPEHIKPWVNSPETKLATRRVKLAVIRSLFKYLSARELVRPNPALLVTVDFDGMSHEEKEAKQVKVFTDAEFRILLTYLEGRIATLDNVIQAATASRLIAKLEKKRQRYEFWRIASIISRCSGLRMSDVATLETACLTPRLTVWTRKSRKRVQPTILNPELYRDATQFIASDKYVFPVQRAIYLDERTRPSLPTEFSRICEAAGLHGFSFHGLRHSYATDCYSRGIQIPHIQSSLGHGSQRVTEGYIQ